MRDIMDPQMKKKSLIPCKNCGQKILRTQMIQHSFICQDESDGRIFRCGEPNCNRAFKKKYQLTTHISGVHSEPFECPYANCNALIKKNSFWNHAKVVHDKVKEMCDRCGKKFSYGNLNEHKTRCTSDGTRPFNCTKEGCQKSFRTPRERMIHIRTIHTGRVDCPLDTCDAVISKQYIPKHMRVAHRRLKEKCAACGKTVPLKSLNDHLESCTSQGVRPFKCTEAGCQLTFKTTFERSQHMTRSHGEPIQCPLPNCDVVVKNSGLLEHVRHAHGKVKEECNKCGKELTYSSLILHSKICKSDGSRSYKCKETDCDESFRSAAERSKHVRSMHSEPVECPVSDCNAVIKKYQLSRHLRTMHDDYKEECSNCSKEIFYIGLKKHLKLCTSDESRPFKCDKDGCTSAFKTNYEKLAHVRNRHTEPIECPIPGCTAVMKKSSVPQHMKHIHDKFKQNCSNCGKKVAYGSLTRHMQTCINNGLRPFKCTKEGCDKLFKNAQQRSGHISSTHSEPVKCTFPDCDVKVRKHNLQRHIKVVHEKLKDKCSDCGKKLGHGNLKVHLKFCQSHKEK